MTVSRGLQLRTLVLNSNYIPVSVFPLYTITAQEAILRVVNNSAYSVVDYPDIIKTPNRTDLHWPSVIANKNGHFFKDNVKLKKQTVLLRDRFECSYCGDPLTHSEMTFDHMIPRSKGGEHSFNNLLSACRDCNTKKANNMPVGRFKPKKMPYTPTYHQILNLAKTQNLVIDDPEWMQFLPGWIGEVKIRKPKESSSDDNDE